MWQKIGAWLAGLFGAAEKVAANPAVDAVALAAGKGALTVLSPQAQVAISSALAMAPLVHQLVQQVQTTHQAVQVVVAQAPAAGQAALAAGASAAVPVVVQALADHGQAVAQLQAASQALQNVSALATALAQPAGK